MNRLTLYALALALSPAAILGTIAPARAGDNPWHAGSDEDAGQPEKQQRAVPPSGVYAPKESYVPAKPKPVYPPKGEKKSFTPIFPQRPPPFPYGRGPYGQSGGPYGRPGYMGAPYGGGGPGYGGGGYPGNGFLGPMGGPSSGAMPWFGW